MVLNMTYIRYIMFKHDESLDIYIWDNLHHVPSGVIKHGGPLENLEIWGNPRKSHGSTEV